LKQFSTEPGAGNERCKEGILNDLFRPSRKSIGAAGETLAAEHLKREGYIILERNFRNRWAEVDIIAFKDATIHFFEVKTRNGDAFGEPEEAVDGRKIRRIFDISRYYFASRPWITADQQVAFAVIAVMLKDGKAVFRVVPFEV